MLTSGMVPALYADVEKETLVGIVREEETKLGESYMRVPMCVCECVCVRVYTFVWLLYAMNWCQNVYKDYTGV